MTDFVENVGLHSQGFNDQQIAQIDAAKDDALHVMATIKAIWPRITRLVPVLTMIAEVVDQHQKESK